MDYNLLKLHKRHLENAQKKSYLILLKFNFYLLKYFVHPDQLLRTLDF